MKLLPICLSLCMVALYAACIDETKYDELTMRDGQTVRVLRDSVRRMPEEALRTGMREAPYDPFPGDSVKWRSSCDSTGYWVETEVGAWGKAWGLSPDKTYFSRAEYYFQMMPVRGDEIAFVYLPPYARGGLRVVGLTEGKKKVTLKYPLQEGYDMDTWNIRGFMSLCAAILHFKYDTAGNVVDVYYPCRPSDLQWFFCRMAKDELLELKDSLRD